MECSGHAARLRKTRPRDKKSELHGQVACAARYTDYTAARRSGRLDIGLKLGIGAMPMAPVEFAMESPYLHLPASVLVVVAVPSCHYPDERAYGWTCSSHISRRTTVPVIVQAPSLVEVIRADDTLL
jgi:hypothetical protein